MFISHKHMEDLVKSCMKAEPELIFSDEQQLTYVPPLFAYFPCIGNTPNFTLHMNVIGS